MGRAAITNGAMARRPSEKSERTSGAVVDASLKKSDLLGELHALVGTGRNANAALELAIKVRLVKKPAVYRHT